MLGFVKKDPGHLKTLDRVRDWTRARFKLSGDDTILVSELACALPGCPPLETVVAFWSDGQRHHLKFFKPAAEVIADDFPPTWMKNALADREGFVCECC